MIEWFHPAILFIGGAFIAFFLKGKTRKALMLLVPIIAFIIVVSMHKGSYWTFNFLGQDITFGKVDRLSLVFSYIFTIFAFISVLYGYHVDDVGQDISAFMYVGSALGAVFAGDYLTLFMFWEIMAFASAYLIFAGRNRASVEAGYRYLLVHTFGGVCLLGGIIIHYIDVGSLTITPLHHDGSLGFYLILLGFIINAAIPPLHAWLPDAYPEATITGAIFLSAFTTKTSVYALTRVFSGYEVLALVGALMAFYGVFYATLQSNIRRLLAYHIISQVGYMVAGIGLGSALAVNGAVAHALNNILYKGLLFMGAGSIMFMTGRKKLTDMGGLHKTMPITMILYLIGGFSISAFPLFNGFISKGMVVSAASHEHKAFIAMLLLLTSAGTFLSTTLKPVYYAFFGKDSGIRAKDPPWNMIFAMMIAAFMCIVMGIFPDTLLEIMPFRVPYEAYTGEHITSSLGILVFAGFAFFIFKEQIHPKKYMSLDTDWFYRMGARIFMWFARKPVVVYEGFITGVTDTIILPIIYSLADIGLWIDRHIIDFMVNAVARFILSMGAFVRRVQTGLVQHYAVAMAGGIMIVIIIYSLMGG